jgi:hypothetical protein
VLAQFWLAWAEFQDARLPAVLWFGPIPSECPTCAVTPAESDVQSEQVMPAITVPSGLDPVRMSCSVGLGEPGHWPLMR